MEADNTLIIAQERAGTIPIYTQFEYPENGGPETSTQESIKKSMIWYYYYNKVNEWRNFIAGTGVLFQIFEAAKQRAGVTHVVSFSQQDYLSSQLFWTKYRSMNR